jgi:hypothetical protein
MTAYYNEVDKYAAQWLRNLIAAGHIARGDVDERSIVDVWLPCSDGKARPTKSGIFPLASRIPNRVGRLRAYGNAIVPQVAAEFIGAAMGLCACKPVACAARSARFEHGERWRPPA